LFFPKEVWNDTDGNPIQAHGGCVLTAPDGRYYWYGEHKGGPTLTEGGCGFRVDVLGISCYSSENLVDWKYEGLALGSNPEPGHDLNPAMVVERPKVIYCAATGEYVMWMHIDAPDYQKAKVGIAVSKTPQGPFDYLGSIAPNGCDSRDMTVFVDDDSKAYLFYSSEWNKTMHISELTPDYRGLMDDYVTAFEDKSVEAPVVMRRGDTYYLVGSNCTGWDPNPAVSATAPSPKGPWKLLGNPCKGPDSEITFYCQSAFAIKYPGKPGEFIIAFDRWKKEDLGDSRYAWFPVTFTTEGFEIEWMSSWEL
jgi:hypothetical protein